MSIQIKHRLPTPSEFVTLRSGVSWGTPTVRQACDALTASLGGVVARRNGETIGMARSIGDGVLNVYIQDVIVASSFQNQGIGRALVSALIKDLSQSCPENCLIGLFAADGQDAFYTQFGFKRRPQLGFGPGMHAALSDLKHFLPNHTVGATEDRTMTLTSNSEIAGIALAKANGAA